MSIASVGLVQTLQPSRPVNQPQPVSQPPDDRDAARARQLDEQEPQRPPAPEPGKGTRVDRTA